VSWWIPSNLNVETRSIAPDEVKRGGKFIEVRGPRIPTHLFYDRCTPVYVRAFTRGDFSEFTVAVQHLIA